MSDHILSLCVKVMRAVGGAVAGLSDVAKVERCRLTLSKPMLKAPTV